MGKLLAEEATLQAMLAGGSSRSAEVTDPKTFFAGVAPLAAVSDVVVDFTHASAVAAHAAILAQTKTPWVLGTTGYTDADSAAIFAAAQHIPVIAAANFATGVNLILLLAERLAAALPAAQYDAEILEMHHRQKVDAPSGTALAIGQAVAAGRHVNLADVKVSGRDGHTGPRRDGDIGFAALRGGQIFGSHTLSFTAADEQISLTHHALDRRLFAAGAIRAAIWVAQQPPGLYTMRDVLGF